MKSRSFTHVFQIDPSRPVPPEALRRPSGDPPEVIALLAEEASRRHGWPARFSAELAKRWATDDIPLLLADADLSGASLHELFDATNDEGVSDLIAFGASAERVIREVAEGAHQFIPSGTRPSRILSRYLGTLAGPPFCRRFGIREGSSSSTFPRSRLGPSNWRPPPIE